jgi:hypothetical protein
VVGTGVGGGTGVGVGTGTGGDGMVLGVLTGAGVLPLPAAGVDGPGLKGVGVGGSTVGAGVTGTTGAGVVDTLDAAGTGTGTGAGPGTGGSTTGPGVDTVGAGRLGAMPVGAGVLFGAGVRVTGMVGTSVGAPRLGGLAGAEASPVVPALVSPPLGVMRSLGAPLMSAICGPGVHTGTVPLEVSALLAAAMVLPLGSTTVAPVMTWPSGPYTTYPPPAPTLGLGAGAGAAGLGRTPVVSPPLLGMTTVWPLLNVMVVVLSPTMICAMLAPGGMTTPWVVVPLVPPMTPTDTPAPLPTETCTSEESADIMVSEGTTYPLLLPICRAVAAPGSTTAPMSGPDITMLPASPSGCCCCCCCCCCEEEEDWSGTSSTFLPST